MPFWRLGVPVSLYSCVPVFLSSGAKQWAFVFRRMGMCSRVAETSEQNQQYSKTKTVQ